jgi:hypothetical protein
MTQSKRPNCRLSMEDSFGFQLLDAIPSHPHIKQLTFPACRTMELSIPRQEQQGAIFVVPAGAGTRAVLAS